MQYVCSHDKVTRRFSSPPSPLSSEVCESIKEHFCFQWFIKESRTIYTAVTVADLGGGGAKGAMPPPPCLVKIGQKDGRQMRSGFIFHVSWPPLSEVSGPTIVFCMVYKSKSDHLYSRRQLFIIYMIHSKSCDNK